jgi:predicted metalloprotease
VVFAWVVGVDLTPMLSRQGQIGPAPQDQTTRISAESQARAEFAAVTLADTEVIWSAVFRDQLGRTYTPPTLVLFDSVTQSPCGGASGATGPFYCPVDQKAYLDLAFFDALARQLGAQGDFAAAYVIAHEVAHHVQNELGILGEVNALRARASASDGNALSVLTELQADCLSGVWAHHAQYTLGTLERGDLSEALNAARRIGDDTLQRSAGRVPQPHTFTHGTSDQREGWFARGYGSGLVRSCDTFGEAGG